MKIIDFLTKKELEIPIGVTPIQWLQFNNYIAIKDNKIFESTINKSFAVYLSDLSLEPSTNSTFEKIEIPGGITFNIPNLEQAICLVEAFDILLMLVNQVLDEAGFIMNQTLSS